METAKIVEPISGDKLYQTRARKVLPILVRQAEAGSPIYYSDLAREAGIPNPRNLNYVLGSIGSTLENLSKAWNEKVPPIQCIVVNKNTGLPGEGVGWFLIKKEDFTSLSRRKQRALVEAELQHIFSFNHWGEVLSELDLEPVKRDYSYQLSEASGFGGKGESEAHKKFKEYVSRNPVSVNLKSNTPEGITEFGLASGDTVDVYFKKNKHWIGIEVKSSISDEADITRGLFQCVKYTAVLEAMQLAEGVPQNVRVILALEGSLPEKLLPLKNLLGIEVVEEARKKG